MKKHQKKGKNGRLDDGSFTRRLMMTVGLVTVTIIIFLTLWFAAEVFLLLFAGILLGLFLRGLAQFLSSKSGLSVNWSLAIVMVVLLIIIVGGGLLLAPQVSEQMQTLVDTIPQSIDRLRDVIGEQAWGGWVLDQVPQSGSSLVPENLVSKISTFFSSTFAILANLVFVTIIGIYLAAKPSLYKRGLIRLFPKQHRERAAEVINEVTFTLQWWLVGQITAMALVGVLTAIGLSLLGIPLALTLGLITALLTFIPNFGPVISLIPPALLGLMESPAHMVYVLLLYFGIQMVESYLITPQIHRKTVSLPPVITLLTQILFGLLFGLPGLILATPLAAAGMVIIKMVYVEDMLEDDDVVLPSEAHENA